MSVQLAGKDGCAKKTRNCVRENNRRRKNSSASESLFFSTPHQPGQPICRTDYTRPQMGTQGLRSIRKRKGRLNRVLGSWSPVKKCRAPTRTTEYKSISPGLGLVVSIAIGSRE
jgi:hypothetical protein